MSKTFKATPMQLAATLLLEGEAQRLQVSANQLGGFLKLTREGDILIQAQQVIIRELQKLQREWAGEIVLAQPGDLKTLERVSP